MEGSPERGIICRFVITRGSKLVKGDKWHCLVPKINPGDDKARQGKKFNFRYHHWLPYWKCTANKHWKMADGRLISSTAQRLLRGTSNMGMYEKIN